jgi:hypothetical protein
VQRDIGDKDGLSVTLEEAAQLADRLGDTKLAEDCRLEIASLRQER